VLLPTTLTLLPLLPMLLPTLLFHDALFSSKNIPYNCSIAVMSTKNLFYDHHEQFQ
jgi:hypothetical protein